MPCSYGGGGAGCSCDLFSCIFFVNDGFQAKHREKQKKTKKILLPDPDYSVVKMKSHFVNHSLHFEDCMSCNTIHEFTQTFWSALALLYTHSAESGIIYSIFFDIVTQVGFS